MKKEEYQKQYYLLKNSVMDALNSRPINSTVEKILRNALDGGCSNCIYFVFGKKKQPETCKRMDIELIDNWVQTKPDWCPYLNEVKE